MTFSQGPPGPTEPRISGKAFIQGLRVSGDFLSNARDDVTIHELSLAMTREETLAPEIRELRLQSRERGSRSRETWIA